MRRFILGLIVAAFALATTAFGSITFQNTTTDTFESLSYFQNSLTQIGDQITLAGTDRLATLATVQVFSDGSAGTFDATLRLFIVGPNPGNPVGSLIGSFAKAGIAAPASDVKTFSFILPNLTVPNSLIFTLSIDRVDAGVDILGPDMFEPPTIGSSNPTFAIGFNGTSFVQVNSTTPAFPGGEDVFFQLDATSVPEPATLGVVGAGLIMLMLRRRRSA